MKQGTSIRSQAARAALLGLATCAVASCQRPGEALPPPPLFSLSASRMVAVESPPAPVPAEPAFVPFRGATVVYFDGDSATLDAAAQAALDRQAEWLLRNPSVSVMLQGHGDVIGSRARQFAIGEMRAAAMRRYLVGRGISPDRVETTSFGKQMPVATSLDQESRRRNRRGETIFKGVARPNEKGE